MSNVKHDIYKTIYKPTNREKSMTPKKTKFWCDCCDCQKVGQYGKCPVCGNCNKSKKKIKLHEI